MFNYQLQKMWGIFWRTCPTVIISISANWTLDVCCEGTAAVSDGVLNGFEAFGKQKKFLPNIEVRGFTTLTNLQAIEKQFKGGTYIGDPIAGIYKPTDWLFMIYDKFGKLLPLPLPLSDFYVKGKTSRRAGGTRVIDGTRKTGYPKKSTPSCREGLEAVGHECTMPVMSVG